jgi:hypothetical protein
MGGVPVVLQLLPLRLDRGRNGVGKAEGDEIGRPGLTPVRKTSAVDPDIPARVEDLETPNTVICIVSRIASGRSRREWGECGHGLAGSGFANPIRENRATSARGAGGPMWRDSPESGRETTESIAGSGSANPVRENRIAT